MYPPERGIRTTVPEIEGLEKAGPKNQQRRIVLHDESQDSVARWPETGARRRRARMPAGSSGTEAVEQLQVQPSNRAEATVKRQRQRRDSGNHEEGNGTKKDAEYPLG
jgi:hypothetical protein